MELFALEVAHPRADITGGPRVDPGERGRREKNCSYCASNATPLAASLGHGESTGDNADRVETLERAEEQEWVGPHMAEHPARLAHGDDPAAAAIVKLRATRRRGPARSAARLGMHPSTDPEMSVGRNTRERRMDCKFHHTAISAVDMAASITFYEQFGFHGVLHWQDPNGQHEIAHLQLGDCYLEIFWFKDQTPAPETAGSLATDLPRIGVKHFALHVNSVDEAKQFVEDRGIASNVDIRHGKTGVTYFFIRDPSGILVELVEDKRELR